MQTPQTEMQQLILTCLENRNYKMVQDCLGIYQNTFGQDSFYESCSVSLLNLIGPSVTLIGLDTNDETIQSYLSTETYQNLEFVNFSGMDYINDLVSYIPTCNSKYLCFLEENQQYAPNRIASMIFHLEQLADLDLVVCTRNQINKKDEIIAHPDYAYEETLGNKILAGKLLLEYSINANVNLYGIPSTLMASTSYVKNINLSSEGVTPDISAMALLYQLLMPARIRYLYTPYVSSYLQEYKDSSVTQKHYEAYLRLLTDRKQLSCALPNLCENTDFPSQKNVLPREITFISNKNGGGFYNVKPLMDEAKRRGFKVHITEDRYEKAEIGVYSQHICHPENAKFSIILLHDMTQGSLDWPNFWEVERWNNFDIGILPGKSWEERWTECNCFYYSHPRHGIYTLGYPKSDQINSDALQLEADNLRRKLGLKYDYTILYAPSWENDNKEDDFVQTLLSLEANLVIKQNDWKKHPEICENIKRMRSMHENKFENVYFIDQEESIMTALALCDLVVSDESNVMTDAILLNKPSIAVTDWLIPDETPCRPACVPIDYVIKCSKATLRETVEAVMSNTISAEEYVKKGRDTFSNIGNSCSEIMDAIEYYTQNAPDNVSTEFLSKKATSSKYAPCTMWN